MRKIYTHYTKKLILSNIGIDMKKENWYKGTREKVESISLCFLPFVISAMQHEMQHKIEKPLKNQVF